MGRPVMNRRRFAQWLFLVATMPIEAIPIPKASGFKVSGTIDFNNMIREAFSEHLAWERKRFFALHYINGTNPPVVTI